MYSFKPKHPLLDLRLFRNRDLAVSIVTMFLFAVAFFGGLLLVPTYFQQIRGESVLRAGLLVAPQGIGAMLTMPITGTLSDKFPVGRIVPFGLVFIAAGIARLTQISSTTSYPVLLGLLFIMGLGMGGTMMPIMTSALKSLRAAEVARGSTLLNITQQIASSVGVAVYMSVILTNGLKDAKLAYPAIAARNNPQIAAQIGGKAASTRAYPRPRTRSPTRTGWPLRSSELPSSRPCSFPQARGIAPAGSPGFGGHSGNRALKGISHWVAGQCSQGAKNLAAGVAAPALPCRICCQPVRRITRQYVSLTGEASKPNAAPSQRYTGDHYSAVGKMDGNDHLNITRTARLSRVTARHSRHRGGG